MTSQSKPSSLKRLTKTHGTFEAIPSLRVSGKDLHSNTSTTSIPKPPTPKKSPQYADQLLFPGRRLDKRQPSTYSGVSGHSGHSGLEQLTLHSSGGKLRAPGSTTGSTKLSHASLPSLNRPFLPDGSDPWGSARQVAREDSPLTMLRRQVAEAEEENRLNAISGVHPPHNTMSKVSRWQQANFSHGNRPLSFETREPLMESPDSMESHESDLQPPVDHVLLQQRELRCQEQKERELRQDLQKQKRGRLTPPPPTLDPTFPTQQPRGMRHMNPHRRPAHTPAVSPTQQPAGSGLKLNKILWALAPDEHANTSEPNGSHQQASCRETSATGDKINTGRFVTLTDLDAGSDNSCHVSDTTPNPQLTQQLLSNHNESATWSRDDRIFQWLSECDQETTSQSLPTHLPDIKYTFKYLKSAT